ncbi:MULTISPECIES: META domain-containing protein [unclassified Halomonas]|uniref:META domain-containing protein n=1 Tax=unclassified Halomonas TaxID=2609666 RepID=UPI001CF4FE01|nr:MULTISPECIES: META domain-containing protein [unclassified Halomonas]UZH09161.1 META domain-containing protein [Halomonas sp. BDJS001]
MKRRLALYGFIGALLITAGCSSAPIDSPDGTYHPDEPLINTYWKLVTLDGEPVVTDENFREAHVVLHQDGSRLAGATGCNTLMGSYRVENEQITFNKIASTKMACSTAQMNNEQGFLAALKQVATWNVDGAMLVLSGNNNEPLAVFEAVHLY